MVDVGFLCTEPQSSADADAYTTVLTKFQAMAIIDLSVSGLACILIGIYAWKLDMLTVAMLTILVTAAVVKGAYLMVYSLQETWFDSENTFPRLLHINDCCAIVMALFRMFFA